ncbi:MAG: hypothetical protein ACREIB_02040, partial [Pseudomonadota bacterium]
DLNTYVYASARAASRINRAIELGALGPVTREAFLELGGGEPDPKIVETPVAEAELLTDRPVSPVNLQAASESPSVDEEGIRHSARVPWLRYGDRPARVAPPRRDLLPQSPDFEPQTPNPPLSYEPLLTEEELNALISEDIAAIAPHDSEARRPDDEDQLRGAL